jgi:hypothetical protein
MEQKKLLWQQLIANGAESTETIALQKNAEKDYNNAVTVHNNAVNQYNVQQIKTGKMKSELDILESKISASAKIIRDNFNFQSAFTVTNNTISYGANRIIDGCTTATIGWEPYGARLLADTLNYFRNNCNVKSEDPSLDDLTRITVYQPPTIFTDCGKWCEHVKWLTNAKEKAKTLHLDLNKPYQNGTK